MMSLSEALSRLPEIRNGVTIQPFGSNPTTWEVGIPVIENEPELSLFWLSAVVPNFEDLPRSWDPVTRVLTILGK